MPRADDDDLDPNQGRDPLRRLLVRVGGLLALGALVLAGHAVLNREPASPVPAPVVLAEAASEPAPTAPAARDASLHDAAAAQASAVARAQAMEQAKAQGAPDRLASAPAAADAARRAADAKARAWQSFYRPSPFCAPPDARTAAECAGEQQRARRAFEAQWAEGSLR